MNLLSGLFLNRQFTPSGRMHKPKIANYISENSLEITELDKYLDIMRRAEIITKINPKTVNFSKNIIDSTSPDELKTIIIEFYSAHSPTLDKMFI